jgi:large subunit ribosomal protein L3
MYPALIGKKVGMTQVFDAQGAVQPVTVVQAGPCAVLQVKSKATDGYEAVQLGFEDIKPQRATRPAVGHAAKAGAKPKRAVREVRLAVAEETAKAGDILTVKIFDGVAHVDVTGTTKGKGFQGTMKRHNFGGQPDTHGTERKHRSQGSIAGYGTDRGHGGDIKKGKPMAGHMGDERCTSRNHKLVGIDEENNLLLIKGPVPGAVGGFVFVRKSKTARIPKVRKEKTEKGKKK